MKPPQPGTGAQDVIEKLRAENRRLKQGIVMVLISWAVTWLALVFR